MPQSKRLRRLRFERQRDLALLFVDEDVQVPAFGRQGGEDLAADAERRVVEVRFLGDRRQGQRDATNLFDVHEPTPRAIRLAHSAMASRRTSSSRSITMMRRYSLSPTTGAVPWLVCARHLMKRIVG